MKTYLAYLLLITGIWIAMPQLAIAKPQPVSTKQESSTAKISPAAALERLILAPKLSASWFTPEFLKAVDKNSDVNTVQFQRDVTLKLGTMRYGNYKSIQSIGGDKYRIIFDRAEPDAVVAQFRLDVRGRIAGIRLAEKRNKPNAQAQVAAQAAVDRSFRTNVGSNGKPNPLFVSLKQWLGNYQKVRKQDETTYVGIFERGSLPLEVNFKTDGSIENYGVGCPVTKLPLSQAHSDLQKIFSNCPNLK
ncbi:hypothetical protein [Chamaesiphon sp. OTE_75_metabat_556]|uniref:hypothetical protein n=1 Tax=Chamaesiphon sp. OTE_75_metabat_556 TaxID=2964692 RepID=UPI00286AA308|nr:hypothetical protein [Chamaesiphon sp. OTE_75_metabat_556]